MGPLKYKKILSTKVNALWIMKFHGFHGNLLSDFKEWVCAYKTHIAAATHSRVLNVVPNYSLDLSVLFCSRYANYLISIFMNINENFRNEGKNLRKYKGCTCKIRPEFFYLLIYKPSYCNLPECRKKIFQKIFFYFIRRL